MTTPEERDYIGEVIREDAAISCAVIGAQNVNSAMSTIDELRQQLADVSHERDLLRAAQGWIKCGDRLPEKGVVVMVYTPPQPGDWPDTVRIDFDSLDPDCDDPYWSNHGDQYEHYSCIAKDDDNSWSGPSESAPYTHWMPLPAAPSAEVKS